MPAGRSGRQRDGLDEGHHDGGRREWEKRRRKTSRLAWAQNGKEQDGHGRLTDWVTGR